MEATIKPEGGKFAVYVGDKLIRTLDTEEEAQKLVDFLAQPGVFLDATDGRDW